MIEATISTHAPLAGRDLGGARMSKIMRPFQPTRPLRGATLRIAWGLSLWIFQPTRPLRGATRLQEQYIILTRFQPTRPLRGATGALHAVYRVVPISTHAPLAGRDRSPRARRSAAQAISTHAPLAGRDSKRVQITMHIFAITDKFQMLLHRMPPVRAFCSFLMQENHADFGCEPPK